MVTSLLLIGASAFRSLRVELGGLLIPLHVVPLLAAVPLAILPSFQRLPARFRIASVAFLFIFAASCIVGSSYGELIKVLTTYLGLFFAALVIRNVGDFRAGALALAIAVLILNLKGIFGGLIAYVGYEPLSGIANKNAYSLYCLPAVMISGFTLLRLKPRFRIAAIHVATIVSSAFIVFSGANRSGWLGVLMIGFILSIQSRQWRALAAISVLGAVSWGAMTWLGSTDVLEYRIEQSREGYSSDELRESLVIAAFETAIDHPLLGASPTGLPFELAARTRFDGDVVDPHNLIGYIAGGAGFPALFAFLFSLFVLLKRPPGALTEQTRAAHDLVRMVVILFLFRGFFSREIITTPAFLMSLGLALGLLEATAQRQSGLQLRA